MSHQEAAGGARVAAVVVSFNRKDLLAKTLAGIAGGRRRPDIVVVVDNASTDGATDFVRNGDFGLPVDLVELSTNVGGAGGFAVGMDRAVHVHEADLVWVMDDDTEPLEGTLDELVSAWEQYAERPEQRPSVVASKVLWSDGREHPMNSMRTRFLAGRAQHAAAERVGARPIRSASFVSCMLSASAVRELGLPVVDYFIWVDDFEHTMRLARRHDAIQVLASEAMHHTKRFGGFDSDPGPRFYNEVRNRIWCYTRSRALKPWELPLYMFSTVRFWSGTFRRSGDKKQLLSCLRRGIKDGVRRPRPNQAVLDGVYELSGPQP
ncbi:glycosyltransferase [Arthrobacter sp. NPDC090010]|uniref:glycosyltransferase n=1 Tax=Arthrobacter sp. NPDC090010 TaxID=3363942 RepID=UPI0037F755CE